eukprot:g3362.t1
MVEGQGVPSPYRLKPFTNIVIPVGLPFSAAVTLYNPDPINDLHIREIFTTKGYIKLQLPNERDDSSSNTNTINSHNDENDYEVKSTIATDTEGHVADENEDVHWTLEPHEHKRVIKFNFRSHKPGNYWGHIQIKSNRKVKEASPNDPAPLFVIPVNISVTKRSNTSVIPYPRHIDFGVLNHVQQVREALLSFGNTKATGVTIVGVSVIPSTQMAWTPRTKFRQVVPRIKNLYNPRKKQTTIQYKNRLASLFRGPKENSKNGDRDDPGQQPPLGAPQRRQKIEIEPFSRVFGAVSLGVVVGEGQGKFQGKIIIRTNSSKLADSRIVVPYSGRISFGELKMVGEEHVCFPSSRKLEECFLRSSNTIKDDESGEGGISSNLFYAPEPSTQNLYFVNSFSEPIQLSQCKLYDSSFEIMSFSKRPALPNGGILGPVEVRFHGVGTGGKFSRYDTPLVLTTNISTSHVTNLRVYNGLLGIKDDSIPSVPIVDRLLQSNRMLNFDSFTDRIAEGTPSKYEGVCKDEYPRLLSQSGDEQKIYPACRFLARDFRRLVKMLNSGAEDVISFQKKSLNYTLYQVRNLIKGFCPCDQIFRKLSKRLTKTTNRHKTLDFGVLGVGSTRKKYVKISNPNPIAIEIQAIETFQSEHLNISCSHVEDDDRAMKETFHIDPAYFYHILQERILKASRFLEPFARKDHSVANEVSSSSHPHHLLDEQWFWGEENGEAFTDIILDVMNKVALHMSEQENNFKLLTRLSTKHVAKSCSTRRGIIRIEPLQSKTFACELTAGSKVTKGVEHTNSVMTIRSCTGQVTTLAGRWQVVRGMLKVTPQIVKFDPSFAHLVKSRNLYATNTINKTVEITEIKSNDPRIIPYVDEKFIPAKAKKFRIGRVEFRVPKSNDFVVPFGVTQVGEHEIEKSIRDSERFDAMEQNGRNTIGAALTVLTNIVPVPLIHVVASIIRPSILPFEVRENGLTFAETQVNVDHLSMSTSSEDMEKIFIPIMNPTNEYIAVQVLTGDPGTNFAVYFAKNIDTDSESVKLIKIYPSLKDTKIVSNQMDLDSEEQGRREMGILPVVEVPSLLVSTGKVTITNPYDTLPVIIRSMYITDTQEKESSNEIYQNWECTNKDKGVYIESDVRICQGDALQLKPGASITLNVSHVSKCVPESQSFTLNIITNAGLSEISINTILTEEYVSACNAFRRMQMYRDPFFLSVSVCIILLVIFVGSRIFQAYRSNVSSRQAKEVPHKADNSGKTNLVPQKENAAGVEKRVPKGEKEDKGRKKTGTERTTSTGGEKYKKKREQEMSLLRLRIKELEASNETLKKQQMITARGSTPRGTTPRGSTPRQNKQQGGHVGKDRQSNKERQSKKKKDRASRGNKNQSSSKQDPHQRKQASQQQLVAHKNTDTKSKKKYQQQHSQQQKQSGLNSSSKKKKRKTTPPKTDNLARHEKGRGSSSKDFKFPQQNGKLFDNNDLASLSWGTPSAFSSATTVADSVSASLKPPLNGKQHSAPAALSTSPFDNSGFFHMEEFHSSQHSGDFHSSGSGHNQQESLFSNDDIFSEFSLEGLTSTSDANGDGRKSYSRPRNSSDDKSKRAPPGF